MSPNKNAKLLTISVHDTNDDGILIIAVPRAVLDSVTDGEDSEFFAFTGSNNIDVEEIDTNEFERTLMIHYPAGTRTIEIYGTFAIPEFGTITAIILVTGIVSMIAITKKYPIYIK